MTKAQVIDWHVEQIDEFHQRAKVPGGWILKAYENVMTKTNCSMEPGYEWRVAMCFVPDPDHSWIIGDIYEEPEEEENEEVD